MTDGPGWRVIFPPLATGGRRRRQRSSPWPRWVVALCSPVRRRSSATIPSHSASSSSSSPTSTTSSSSPSQTAHIGRVRVRVQAGRKPSPKQASYRRPHRPKFRLKFPQRPLGDSFFGGARKRARVLFLRRVRSRGGTGFGVARKRVQSQ
jgi:hypothetical protein